MIFFISGIYLLFITLAQQSSTVPYWLNVAVNAKGWGKVKAFSFQNNAVAASF
jgi:hypothetical protein